MNQPLEQLTKWTVVNKDHLTLENINGNIIPQPSSRPGGV